ncbi:MAG: bifunctional metallophosphatase/5'-nucleotidase [Geobacteraceae bacterium]|nr:bifunctional metallophosphatase/5'-nucleotidase [Geobacteraceae bacterium]
MKNYPSIIGRLALAILLPVQLMAMGGCTSTGYSTANLKAKVLAINDFHGQISEGKTAGKGEYNKVGSAPVLAAYLKNAQAGMEERSFIVSVGDLVGASPAVSALLQDEPTIMFVNTLANDFCREPMHPRCNIVATVGNHEFDEGVAELSRLIHGRNHAKGPFLENPYTGAHFPYVAANVQDKATGSTLLPPYVIKTVDGVPIAFIGAVLKNTPNKVSASGIEGISFTDEASAINSLIPEIQAKGVHAVVAFIHQGGSQPPYPGKTDPLKPLESIEGDMKPVTDIVSRLDGEVDLVLTAHYHAFTNALVRNAAGREVLVTQAYSAGTAFADIDLEIDPKSRDIVGKSASIITTWARNSDGKPAVPPDAAAAELLAGAEKAVGPTINKVISSTDHAITRRQNRAGESDLGNLAADAMRKSTGTDFAFINPGGLRADLAAGEVTWGHLYSVLPFGNLIVTMQLRGEQVYQLLTQQWVDPAAPRMLQTSGLSYTWMDNGPGRAGTVIEVKKNGVAIDRSLSYSVATVNFLATGGDGFSVFKEGAGQVNGPVDIDVLVSYLKELPRPFSIPETGRVKRLSK